MKNEIESGYFRAKKYMDVSALIRIIVHCLHEALSEDYYDTTTPSMHDFLLSACSLQVVKSASNTFWKSVFDSNVIF